MSRIDQLIEDFDILIKDTIENQSSFSYPIHFDITDREKERLGNRYSRWFEPVEFLEYEDDRKSIHVEENNGAVV